MLMMKTKTHYLLRTSLSIKNGTLVDNGDGTWTFTPQIDDDTEVSFTFDIIDDEDLVVSGSANLDILPINDAPNAENDVITTKKTLLLLLMF